MKARLVRVGWVALVLFACLPLLAAHAAKSQPKAETPDPVQAASPEWPSAELTLGIQARDSETEGIGDVLIPIWNPGGTGLLFVNPRTAFTDSDEQEVNFGIGYRQLLPNRNIILGANAYYDYRDVDYGNYDQWGVGVEMLSTWIDARANYYNPENKKLVVNTQTETTSSQSVRTSSSWSDVYPEDYGFYQDYVVTRTLTTETITRTFEQYQQALGGFDLELGTRLPLPAKPETIEAKIFGGYYDFDRDFGDDAQGWKARAEVRLLSSLFLDAGLYENDDLTGSDWFVGARFSVPLDLAAIAKGRNPFSDVRSRMNREPRDFSARLTEMVQRDPQIRLETSKFIENESLSSTTTQSQSTRQRLALNILPDVVFVYGDATSPGDGSAEHPFSTIQQGVNSAFGLRNVYVHDFSGPYNENVVLSPNTVLLGSGYPVAGLGGLAYGGNSAPIVDGLNLGPTITMANNTRVSGFQIRNTGPSFFPDRGDFGNRSEPDLLSRVGILAEGNLGDLTITHNLIEGCSYGARLEAEGNFSLLFENNVVRNNDRDGIRISGYGSEVLLGRGTFIDEPTTFNVVLNNNVFSANRGYGASIRATSYETALTGLNNNDFTSNGRSGAYIGHRDSILSMIYASGGSASGNEGSGLSTIQYDNWVSLLNLSGLSANRNGEAGISIMQDSELVSAAVVGMPQGIGSLVSGITGLPEELNSFFQASGGVSASDNAIDGVYAEITANSISLGAFFDVTANRNTEDGVHALVDAEEGFAIALAGSSQNLSDLVQLGSDVLDVLNADLPVSLSLPGNGQFQASNNGGNGLALSAGAETFALAGVIGAETSGNTENGTLLASESTNIAATLAARVTAISNSLNGIYLSSISDDMSFGLLADVNASHNTENGISANIVGDDVAALLALSTDALRPIASYYGENLFGEPYELPGTTFGPVITSGNGDNGISALVAAEDTALSAFLDVHASNNGSFGFDVTTVSTEGSAITAFLSSDLIYDLAGDLLGLPEEIGRPELGGVQANDNNLGGILSSTVGYDSASALFAGVQANGNGTFLTRGGDVRGDGIRAGLQSADGDVNAYFIDVEANENRASGIVLDAEGLSDVDVAAVHVDAIDNRHDGLRFDLDSQSEDVFALVAGADASGNGDDGISIRATADDDASVGISDTIASGNDGNGIYASVQGGDYADFFVGNLAVEDLDNIYDFIDDVGILGALIPQGEVTASGNGLNGVSVSLVAGAGDATFVASETTADDNTGNGIDFSIDSSAGTGDALAYLFFSQTLGNDNTDINGSVESDAGDAIIFGTNVVYSGYSLSATTGSGTADIDINP